ncbi:Crp/Fnr family transcriptional regulator [Dinghuibacter silviterrae]|uniref:CRP-like cAMP-binding protein n=1 Tax=Dinghuibacter silviterrae TaxID=1539049 RepID=A0A4R8DS68_9BACT|nr:Crp/Fnr family transcriptional regulator [Dinghuibacter silviterrae]TDX00869.1 CRP-like cAMP-binding protein [Dinghuibacter silviterrae]
MNDFFNTINDIVPLAKEVQMALAKTIRILRLERGQPWIREGDSAHHLAFISEGYLRKYRLREGREVTEGFYFDNAFAADLPPVLTGRPVRCSLVAMERTELFLLPYAVLGMLARDHPSIEHLVRTLVERDFIAWYYRYMELLTTPLPERYVQFVQDHPLVLERAEARHVATFLGMTNQQFSRARAGHA